MLCTLCPNMCAVDRQKQLGACRATSTMHIARIAPHHYEEPPISGTHGSGTVFFSACTMRCKFCQNHTISQTQAGTPHTPKQLADALRALCASGVHNINFVTPTHHADGIMDALAIYRPPLPIIYNSSGYERAETLQRLSQYIDVWLPDFKYSDTQTAQSLSSRPAYPDVARASIAQMLKTPKRYKDGLIKSGVIIRHLVLPSFLDNSKGVLDIIKSDFGTDVTLSLMAQYTPVLPSPIAALNRTLKPIEYKLIVAYAQSLGFHDILTQELSSAKTDYIPSFDK